MADKPEPPPSSNDGATKTTAELEQDALLRFAGNAAALAVVQGAFKLVNALNEADADLAVELDRDGEGRPLRYRLVLAPHIPIPPGGMSPSPDTVSILAAIRGLGNTMTDRLNAAVAALLQSDAALKGEIDQLVADDAAARQSTAKAVADALAAEGVSEDAQAAILETLNNNMAAHSAEIFAVLNPNPVASVQISPSDLTGTVGVLISGKFSSNLDGNVGFKASGDLPDDLTVNPDGSYSWTPAEAESGNFTVSATSGTGQTGSDTVTYEIAAAAS